MYLQSDIYIDTFSLISTFITLCTSEEVKDWSVCIFIISILDNEYLKKLIFQNVTVEIQITDNLNEIFKFLWDDLNKKWTNQSDNSGIIKNMVVMSYYGALRGIFFFFLCAAESRTLRRAQRRERRWTRRWSRCWTWSWSGWSSASTNRPPSRPMATGPPSWTTRCPVRRSVHARPGNDQSELLRRPSPSTRHAPPLLLPPLPSLIACLFVSSCSLPFSLINHLCFPLLPLFLLLLSQPSASLAPNKPCPPLVCFQGTTVSACLPLNAV